MKYRLKDVQPVDAVQFWPDTDALPRGVIRHVDEYGRDEPAIWWTFGWQSLRPGDWIINGREAVPAHVFSKTYEPAE